MKAHFMFYPFHVYPYVTEIFSREEMLPTGATEPAWPWPPTSGLYIIINMKDKYKGHESVKEVEHESVKEVGYECVNEVRQGRT